MKIDLQMFADGLIGDGVEDDDLSVKEDVEDDDELESLFAEDDEPDEEADEEPEEEPQEEPEDEPVPDGKFYTQDELNNLISSRLQRERAKFSNIEPTVEAVRQLEKAAGMPVGDILEHIKGNRVQAYVDNGMDEEKARKQVDVELEYEQLKEKSNHLEGYVQNLNRSMQYDRQKSAFLSKTTNLTPYYKKLEDEIDKFAGFGENLSFEDAAKYILGDKVAKGEIIEDIRKGAENKLLATSQKRGKATIESGSQAGGKTEGKLSAYERNAARELGFSDKEWMDSKKALSKRKKR